MRILQLCLRVPYPPKDGGTMAMHAITEGLLANGCKVKVIAVNTPKHFTELTAIDATYLEKTQLETVFINTNINIFSAFYHLFSGKSYNIERFYSRLFEKKLIAVLRSSSFDVILLESLFMAPYIDAIRKYSSASIILRSHNLEYKIWERLTHHTLSPLKKWYLNHLSKRLKKYELETLQKLDGIASISPKDVDEYKTMGSKCPVYFMPYTTNLERFQQQLQGDNTSIFHLASMDWMPNLEGVMWFLQHVWPIVEQKNKTIKLFLAGKEMPREIFQLDNQNTIHVEGAIHRSTEFMKNKQVMIVPLLSGGGIRIKIIEGLALGKTIISTSIGAEGIAIETGKNILIADTPEDFANAILLCASDEELCYRIGENAHQLALEKYDIKKVSSSLIDFFRRCNYTKANAAKSSFKDSL